MKTHHKLLIYLIMAFVSTPSAQAQWSHTNSVEATGEQRRATRFTNSQNHAPIKNQRIAPSHFTSNISRPALPVSSFSTLAHRSGPTSTNGLPVCRLDSFVYEAGSRAELVYGDEGADGPPPIDGFNQENRIDSGINGERAEGLTTGHQSRLPSSWGRDEFIGGPEYFR